jgi:phenylpyruvate tautomerase PptA (4-oxalocrotonate tautomerase family)
MPTVKSEVTREAAALVTGASDPRLETSNKTLDSTDVLVEDAERDRNESAVMLNDILSQELLALLK